MVLPFVGNFKIERSKNFDSKWFSSFQDLV